MNNGNFNNFFMEKTAIVGSGGAAAAFGMAEATKNVLTNILPYVILLPMVAGAGGGWAASKMSSPSKSDTDTLQKELVLSKVKTDIASREREMEVKSRLRSLDKALAKTKKPKVDPFVRL